MIFQKTNTTAHVIFQKTNVITLILREYISSHASLWSTKSEMI